jgi:phage terminase Nu1 subunit (DNA packaging protein)
MADLLNRRELAEVFGVTERTVANWLDEGLPARSRDLGQRRYDARAVAGWLLGRRHRLFRLDVRDDELAARAQELLDED